LQMRSRKTSAEGKLARGSRKQRVERKQDGQQSSMAPKKRNRAPGLPQWTLAQLLQLHAHVRLKGQRWQELAKSGAFPGRTAASLRQQWPTAKQAAERSAAFSPTDDPEKERSLGRTEAVCASKDGDLASSSRSHSEQSGESRTDASLHEDANIVRIRADRTAVRNAQWSELRTGMQSNGRGRSIGHLRGWTSAIISGRKSSMKVAPGVRKMAKVLQLHKRERQQQYLILDPIACKSKCAKAAIELSAESSKVSMAQRDRLGLVFYPYDTLPTLLSARNRRPYIAGQGIRLRRMLPEEAARLMGITIVGARWNAAKAAGFSEDQLFAAVAGSVDRRMVDAMVDIARQRDGFDGHDSIRYGSLFSGAFDAFFEGWRRTGMGVAHCMAVEIDPKRRAVLQAAYDPTVVLNTVEAAVIAARAGGLPKVDVLTASPPCNMVSQARRVRSKDKEREDAKAMEEMVGYFSAIGAVSEAVEARVVMIEESDGLRGRYQAVLSAINGVLSELPFAWHHGAIRAEDLGACHRRSRLGWVGIRTGAVSDTFAFVSSHSATS